VILSSTRTALWFWWGRRVTESPNKSANAGDNFGNAELDACDKSFARDWTILVATTEKHRPIKVFCLDLVVMAW
jgi:hypothetical protein